MATHPALDPSMSSIEIRGAMNLGYESISTPAAVELVADLPHRSGDALPALLFEARHPQTALELETFITLPAYRVHH